MQTHLAAIRRPLEFAARDDFAHIERLRDLDGSVAQACRRALALAIPPDLRGALDAVAARFQSTAAGEQRRESVGFALEQLAPWWRAEAEQALLARPVGWLAGVGPKRAAALGRRGLATVGDLLFHLPIRYDDRRSLERVGDLEVGRHATFLAEVRSAERTSVRVRGRLKSVLRSVVGDESGSVVLKWFRAPNSLEALLQTGTQVLVTGDVKRYRFDKELVHPELEVIAAAGAASGAQPGAEALASRRQIVAEYSTPEGISSRNLRRWIAEAVACYSDLVPSHFPESRLPSAAEALRLVHAPPPSATIDDFGRCDTPAHQRLVLEELYLLELGLALRRARDRRLPGVALEVAPEHSLAVLGALPFDLTGAQKRAWAEIRRDLEDAHPMHRLLQGDVGSGKTAVAFLAAMAAAANGYQSVFMAPTELLAEQHARTLASLLASMPEQQRPRVELLSASLPKPRADAVRRGLESGEILLAVGTHALVAGQLQLPRLALAIIDEQHRFGVQQRAALAGLAAGEAHPHVLVMTATPIPRTLALTVYGDLDVSVIDELPPGRTPVKTIVLRAGEGQRVVDLVRETAARGEQVYVVYPLVEESEKTDLRAASKQAELIRSVFKDLRVDLIHGRQPAAERSAAMARFERGETQVMVATTVIEVGVDIPRATLMVVEHAERFGLAQLHQLRGRVGRGARAGTVVLVSRGGGRQAEARLEAMLQTTDGFAIADADLRIRGPGEFLGTRQTGHLPDLRIADLVRDVRWVALAREAAREAVRADPKLLRDPDLHRAVEARWGERLALVDGC